MYEQLRFELFEEALIDPLGGRVLTQNEESIARMLLGASSKEPFSIKNIRLRVNLQTGELLTERGVKGIVRKLRKVHKFPILSRRFTPSGYWWCTSREEMESFIESFKSQALDELHTLSQIVKHNYPTLIGQLKLELDREENVDVGSTSGS